MANGLPPPIDPDLLGQPLGVILPPPLEAPSVAAAPAALPPPVVVPTAAQGQATAPPQPLPPPIAPELLGAPTTIRTPAPPMPAIPEVAAPAGAEISQPEPAPEQPPGVVGAPEEQPAALRAALDIQAAEVERSRETEEALDRYATQIEAREMERQRREGERMEALQTARDTYAADLERYQQREDKPLLSGGGKIALIVGAALHGLGAALSRGRLQNNAFQLVQTTLQERARQLAAEDARAREKLQLRRGQVEDLLSQEGEVQRQTDLAHASLGMKLATELREIGARATTDQERAKYETLAEQFFADARARAEKAAGDRAMAQLDAVGKVVDIEKTLAEIGGIRSKTAADAAAARGEQGPGIGVRPAESVYLPGTDVEIARFAGKDAPKRAAAANELVIARDEFLRQINEYEAAIENYGKKGLFDQSRFGDSPEFRELETARGLLAAPLAKVLAGGYNPSVMMEERAARMVSLPEGWWQRSGAALAGVRKLRANAEEGFRTAAGQHFNTATTERIIAHRRARSVSEGDAAEAQAARAKEILANPKSTAEQKTAAVSDTVSNARKKAAEGDKGDWIYLAGPALIEARGQLRANDPAVKLIDKELKKIRSFAEDRAETVSARAGAIRKGTGKAGGTWREPQATKVETRRERDDRLMAAINDALGED